MSIKSVTTVSILYNAQNFNDKTSFYMHNGQYINDVIKNESMGYTIYYSNGNISNVVSGDTKIKVISAE